MPDRCFGGDAAPNSRKTVADNGPMSPMRESDPMQGNLGRLVVPCGAAALAASAIHARPAMIRPDFPTVETGPLASGARNTPPARLLER